MRASLVALPPHQVAIDGADAALAGLQLVGVQSEARQVTDRKALGPPAKTNDGARRRAAAGPGGSRRRGRQFDPADAGDMRDLSRLLTVQPQDQVVGAAAFHGHVLGDLALGVKPCAERAKLVQKLADHVGQRGARRATLAKALRQNAIH